MPGSNFWAILLFFTLIVLGFSSAFVMLDVAATVLVDSGLKYSRPTIVTGLTLLSFLMCLPYCTEFGYWLLNGIDRFVNNVLLIAVVWGEVVTSTTIYRYTDVVSQVGWPAFITYNVGFIGAQVFGIALGHGIGNPGAGAGAGIGFYVAVSLLSVFLAHTPTSPAPSFWGKPTALANMPLINKFAGQKHFLARYWYLAFYSGNQLRRDLNLIVGQGRNWKIPSFLPFLLRYVSGPVLAIILSFAFPEFHQERVDPLMILGFIIAILGLCAMIFGLIFPRYYDVFVPPQRRAEGTEDTVVNELKREDSLQETVSEEKRGGSGNKPETDVEVGSGSRGLNQRVEA